MILIDVIQMFSYSNYFHNGTTFIIALYQIYSSDMEMLCFTMFLFVFHCTV